MKRRIAMFLAFALAWAPSSALAQEYRWVFCYLEKTGPWVFSEVFESRAALDYLEGSFRIQAPNYFSGNDSPRCYAFASKGQAGKARRDAASRAKRAGSSFLQTSWPNRMY